MTNTTVPTPDTPGQPRPKRADELEGGDWIAWNDGANPTVDTVEVLSAHARNGEVLVVLAAPQGTPAVVRVPADQPVQLAPADHGGRASAELKPYAQVAAELRRIADVLAGLTELSAPYVAVDIQPELPSGSDSEIIAAVDAAASALLGKPGEIRPMGNSHYRYASGYRGQIRVSVYQSVSNPERVKLEAELEQLRAEVEALRNRPADTGLDYSREPDAPTAAPVPTDVDGLALGVRPTSGAGRP